MFEFWIMSVAILAQGSRLGSRFKQALSRTFEVFPLAASCVPWQANGKDLGNAHHAGNTTGHPALLAAVAPL